MITSWTNCGNDAASITLLPETSAEGSFDYCTKLASRLEGPWMDCESKREEYKGEDLKCMETPLPWQQKVLDSVATEPDDRTINWIYNAEGNVGKSKLMKYMYWKKLGLRIPMGTSNQLRSSTVEKGPHRCYLVDLPRSRGADDRLQDLFAALEEIKNGWVETAMYGKAKVLMMKPPHLWVMSNFPPVMDLASQDRWKIWTIDSDGVLQPYLLSTPASVDYFNNAD